MADEVVLDLTNYKDRVGSRVTPGRYKVYVEDAELDSTREGKPMINIWLRVQEGSFEGATVIDRLLPAHEKALFRVVGFMQAIGLPTPKKRMKLNVRQFIGRQLEVDIEDGEPYNGRVKSEIRGYYRIEGSKGGFAGNGGKDLTDLIEEETKDVGTVLDKAGPDLADIADANQAPAEAPNKADARPAQGAEAQSTDDEVDLDQLDL